MMLCEFIWGLDLSGLSGQGAAGSSPRGSTDAFSPPGLYGAFGIGGLLAVEETGTGGMPEYWFLYDGNSPH